MKKKKIVLITTSILAVILAIGFFALYQYTIKPMNTIVLEVGDSKVSMRYFIKRIVMSEDQQSLVTLQTLMSEKLIIEGAKGEPFNLTVTDEEIDEYMKTLTPAGSEISENEYKEWYRQQLNESGLTEAEFREMASVPILQEKMTAYFGSTYADGLEQVKLNVIMLDTPESYDEIKRRYEAGESFGALAEEFSCDTSLAESAGEYDWIAKGELEDNLDQVVFGLDVNEISELVTLDEDISAVFMVSQKDSARQASEETLEALEQKALNAWLEEAYNTFDIGLYGLNGEGYDSETDAWVNWQISKLSDQDQDAEADEEATPES